jgi:hypothetical protein
MIIDQAPKVPVVREQRDRFYQIFWHKSGQMYCIEQAITGVRSPLPGELVVG